MAEPKTSDCFICDAVRDRCDCGLFDEFVEQPTTPEQKYNLERMKKIQQAHRELHEAKCVQKSSKGLSCETLKYVGGEHCRVCPKNKKQP